MSGKSSPLQNSFEVLDFYHNYKIQTKSIEATLLPLVSQVHEVSDFQISVIIFVFVSSM